MQGITQTSGRKSPCPCCGRPTDDKCRWGPELLLCHQGTTYSPPPHLRPGDVLTIDGAQWQLKRLNAGFSGMAALFRPYTPPRTAPPRRIVRRRPITDPVAAVLAFADQEERYVRALGAGDLPALSPVAFRAEEKVIAAAVDAGRRLDGVLPAVWGDHPSLERLYRPRWEAMRRHLRDLADDLEHNRRGRGAA